MSKQGCARDQGTTQYCAEAMELEQERSRLTNEVIRLTYVLDAANARIAKLEDAHLGQMKRANDLFVELTAANADREQLREAALDALSSLVATVTLLEHPQPIKAAPSNKMFAQMMADYRAAIVRCRAALDPFTKVRSGA
jgi:hypothetical protein